MLALLSRLSEEAVSKKVFINLFFFNWASCTKEIVGKFLSGRLPFPFLGINVIKLSLWNGIEPRIDSISFLVSRRTKKDSSSSKTRLIASPRSVNSKKKPAVWCMKSLFWLCTKRRYKNDCAQNPKVVQRRHFILLLHSKKALNDKLHRVNVNWKKNRTHFCMCDVQYRESLFSMRCWQLHTTAYVPMQGSRRKT